VFRFAYSTKTPSGRVLPPRSKTTVFIPRRHDPDGYDAEAKGASISRKGNSQPLVLTRQGGASKVTLTVGPNS
jgi:hypothetical protein